MNIVVSIRLLQTAHEIGVRRFLFASTGGAIYGEPLFAPQTEEHPQNPLSPYGCAKLAVEHYLYLYRHLHGLLPSKVVPNYQQPATRYLVPDDRDFFAVYRRLPGPIAVPLK